MWRGRSSMRSISRRAACRAASSCARRGPRKSDRGMIAGRFEKLGYVGTAIKARDNETAQTVLLVDVRNLDGRLAGVFHPALQSIFAIVEDNGRTLAAAEFVHARTLAETFGGEHCHPKRAAEIVAELADG